MVREQVLVRYQLLPYWYTLFAEWAHLGQPILRPIWYDLNSDDLRDAWSHANDHFMVGESILVRTISSPGVVDLNVHFPSASSWFNFWDLSSPPISGGQTMKVQTHPSHVPAYVRSGSILFRKMRRRRSTSAMAADPFSIYVFGSSARSRLYLDDGHSHEFEGGSYIYDEFVFDGVVLREKPGPHLRGVPSKGLRNFPQQYLQAERVVFVGLGSLPVGAHMVADGKAEAVQFTTAKEGGLFSATVKKPTLVLGTQWSLELSFSHSE